LGRAAGLHEDDERRAQTLYELLQPLPSFVTGLYLREQSSGRLMSLTVWESEQAPEAAEEAVSARPVEDQRGIRPSRVGRWNLDARFQLRSAQQAARQALALPPRNPPADRAR
jgi:hypothetical protein